jgi:hypothetical protein
VDGIGAVEEREVKGGGEAAAARGMGGLDPDPVRGDVEDVRDVVGFILVDGRTDALG